MAAGTPRERSWTLLTNHGHVLLAVARSGDARVSEIAAQVGITGRATLAILKDLEAAGYLTRERVGRRSHYTVDGHRPFRHPATASHEVGELLAVLAPESGSQPGEPGRAPRPPTAPRLGDVRYLKGHGTENDFVLLPDPEREIDLTPQLVAALCDRRAGIGGDGVLRVVLAATDPEGAQMSDEARWFMDYRNADGAAVEMCGNGIRVFARYLVDSHLEPPGEVAVATRDGVKRVRLGMTGDVTVEMGEVTFPGPEDMKVAVADRSWPAVSVDVGNPHAVVFVDDLREAGDLREPPATKPAFSSGVNVEFVVDRGDRHVEMRVHERGVGETRSCGTGACAVMAAAAARAGEAGPTSYVVDVPGGRLTVTRRADGQVELTGPAVLVGEGVLSDEWLAAVPAG